MDHYLPSLSRPAARWLRFFAVLVAVVALGWLVNRLSAVLTPIAIAMALAYIVNPTINWLERRGMRRGVSISIIFVLVIGGLLALAAVLSYVAAVQLMAFSKNVPTYFTQAQQWLETNQPDLMRRLGNREELGSLAGKYGADAAAHAGHYAAIVFSGVAGWAMLFVLVPLYTFFFLWNFNGMTKMGYAYLPGAYRETIVRIVRTIDRSMSEFFRGRLIICAVYGLLIGVGWMIVGTPYSLPLGLLAGALNLVPAMSALVLVPALIVSYVEAMQGGGGWMWPVIYTMAVFLVAQAIESFVLAPWVTGQTSGLHPVTTVVVLFIGAELAGLLGLLLSIPIASTLKSLAGEFLVPELKRLAAEPPRDGGIGPPAAGP